MGTALPINNLVLPNQWQKCLSKWWQTGFVTRLQKGLYPPADVVNRAKYSSHTISQSSLNSETTFLPYQKFDLSPKIDICSVILPAQKSLANERNIQSAARKIPELHPLKTDQPLILPSSSCNSRKARNHWAAPAENSIFNPCGSRELL